MRKDIIQNRPVHILIKYIAIMGALLSVILLSTGCAPAQEAGGEVTPTHTITLYAGDGTLIRKWETTGSDNLSQTPIGYFTNATDETTYYHGTSVVRPHRRTTQQWEPKYTITLYSTTGKVIERWTAANVSNIHETSVAYFWNGDEDVTEINGTYIIEPYRPDTSSNNDKNSAPPR